MKKIISIVSVGTLIVALREDGTVWKMNPDDKRWRLCPSIDDEVRRSELQEFMHTNVVDLNISGRAKSALRRSGILKVNQLSGLTGEALRRMPSVGDKSFYEIKKALADGGLLIED